MHSYIYTGFFIEKETLLEAVGPLRLKPLPKEISFPHVTVFFRPETVETELFGLPVHVTVNGYASNGKNEGVRVSLTSDDERLSSLIAAVEVPHITLSVAYGAKPVDTKYLSFHDTEPIELTALFGAYKKDGAVVTQPE